MGTSNEYADYVLEQLADAGELTKRAMFGEFCLYLDTKVVGFICDDVLFVKPTGAGLAVLAAAGIQPEFGPAYPGSKDYLVVTFFEDRKLAAALVRATADALPLPAPKKPRQQRTQTKQARQN